MPLDVRHSQNQHIYTSICRNLPQAVLLTQTTVGWPWCLIRLSVAEQYIKAAAACNRNVDQGYATVKTFCHSHSVSTAWRTAATYISTYSGNVFQPTNPFLLHMSRTQESQTSDDRRAVAKLGDLQTRYTVGSRDPVYHAKAKILNDALQEIDMGKFQVSLSIYASYHNNSCIIRSGIYSSWLGLAGPREIFEFLNLFSNF